ncbi:glycosyltransferase [Clostridium cuniculi]|uniref:glycosyltransferase n=1 Tax=Clostridium cuniculi TaxID=2548455 RepID=UPI0018AC2A0C|nr:glycosyltransferase [Clostridium cuniculi]
MNNVIAITVTFNRSHTLINTITALLNQNYNNLNKIIIVDNCSDYGHKEKINEISKLSDKIEVINLEENLGGAGGFYFGMKYAMDKYNPDWYWIMDDDAYPRENCLEKLMDNSESDNIGFICPMIWGVTKKQYQIYHHKNISLDLVDDLCVIDNIESIKERINVQANAFVGPLISKKAVERYGYPDKELFIYGDDTEYTYRISREMDGFLVRDAIIDHEDLLKENIRSNSSLWFKEYYNLRNRILLINQYSTSFEKRIFSSFKMIFIGMRSILAAFIKREYKGNRLKRAKVFSKAIIDGIMNKKGKRVTIETFK